MASLFILMSTACYGRGKKEELKEGRQGGSGEPERTFHPTLPTIQLRMAWLACMSHQCVCMSVLYVLYLVIHVFLWHLYVCGMSSYPHQSLENSTLYGMCNVATCNSWWKKKLSLFFLGVEQAMEDKCQHQKDEDVRFTDMALFWHPIYSFWRE